MDETDTAQTPPELLVILAALADEGIPVQTIAPKFTGRFNKGVDYVGDVGQFEQEFNEDLAVIAFAVKQYGLPSALKLSVHSGSDKFSLYGPMRRGLVRFNAGLHLKTAGTTWLEEVIGLAEAGGEGLALAKEIYAGALAQVDELCAPYAAVIDIDRGKLPSAGEVRSWSAEQFVAALRHDQRNPAFNPHLRQLLHVGYKIAAKMGARYLEALEACETSVSRNVTENLYERHIKPLFLQRKTDSHLTHPMKFIHEDFLLQTRTAARLYHQFAETGADLRLSLPPFAAATSPRTGSSRTCSRSGWRATTTSGGRCAPTAWPSASAPATPAVREVPGLGGHRAAHAAQPALPLDPPGAQALLRHRRIARRKERGAHLEEGQRATGHAGAERAGHPEEVQGRGALHHRRSDG